MVYCDASLFGRQTVYPFRNDPSRKTTLTNQEEGMKMPWFTDERVLKSHATLYPCTAVYKILYCLSAKKIEDSFSPTCSKFKNLRFGIFLRMPENIVIKNSCENEFQKV